jgi:hypothetical protein
MHVTPDANALAVALLSPGPHPDLLPEQQIFAPFIGSWDLLVTWYGNDSRAVRRERGEWHFAWVLEGRAIQDVWIVPPRAERAGRGDLYEYGTSLRFFDPTLRAWRSTWFGPAQHAIHSFTAQRIGDEVVLETTPGQGRRMRWVFTEVTQERFVWRNYWDTGHGFTLTQDFQARRAGSMPSD